MIRRFRAPLSDEAVGFYVDQGFLVAEAVFTGSEIEALREDTARFANGEYQAVNPEAGQRILCVHFPHWVSPLIRSTITQPNLADIVTRITGAHLPHWDGAAKCMQSMLFVKPPGLPGQAWHQDERYIPTRDRSLVGAWIALDDATEENGCLRVIPGSHRNGYLWPTRDHGRPDEFDFSDECHGFEEQDESLVEVAAGDVVFFNGYLLHRSLRNRSHGARRALVHHYCNAWSLLPWAHGKEVKAETIATMDNRMVVPLGTDPYAWKGYTKEPEVVFLRPYEGEPGGSGSGSGTP